MTPKLRQIFGCELCIIPKDIHIYFNISRTRRVTDLQQNYVNRDKHNRLFSTKSYANEKIKYFQMVKVYMIISNMMISESLVFI